MKTLWQSVKQAFGIPVEDTAQVFTARIFDRDGQEIKTVKRFNPNGLVGKVLADRVEFVWVTTQSVYLGHAEIYENGKLAVRLQHGHSNTRIAPTETITASVPFAQ